ncbi:hypothetical protein COO60DRAFT_1460541 [Scenedesmus sp. NREL 46B-D3]|nr:hypothetical protein COO60DRAFT_1460541 [Scenedesmus sp. NREL 46B-D3]
MQQYCVLHISGCRPILAVPTHCKGNNGCRQASLKGFTLNSLCTTDQSNMRRLQTSCAWRPGRRMCPHQQVQRQRELLRCGDRLQRFAQRGLPSLVKNMSLLLTVVVGGLRAEVLVRRVLVGNLPFKGKGLC